MTTNQETWQACPQGQLQQMATSLRAHQRRRSMLRVTAVVAGAVLVAVGVGVVDSMLRPTDREIGGIVCSDVIPLLPKYKAGNIDDPQLLARLRKHLTGCQRCTAHYRELTVQEISHRPTTAQVTLLREAAAR